MGRGYSGFFRGTWGAKNYYKSEKNKNEIERHRIGRPVPPTEMTLDMALNKGFYVEMVIKKYNIHLKSGKTDIKVVIDPNIVQAGKVVKDRPNVIVLGQGAFYSEYELANTIAHELNHARSYLKGGTAPEDTAYPAGNALEDYIRGNR